MYIYIFFPPLISIWCVNNSISFKFEIFWYAYWPFIFLTMGIISTLSIFTGVFRLLYVTECLIFSPIFILFPLILYLLSYIYFKYLHKYFDIFTYGLWFSLILELMKHSTKSFMHFPLFCFSFLLYSVKKRLSSHTFHWPILLVHLFHFIS